MEADTAKLNLLVIATQRTPLAARISMALAEVGFRVAALTPYGHLVRRTRYVRAHFPYRLGFGLGPLLQAFGGWCRDLLVCTADPAVWKVQALHRVASASHDEASRWVSKLIELSLGPESSFRPVGNKSAFLEQVELE